VRLVLCDDHRLFTDALVVSLVDRGQSVIACVTDPNEAVRVVSRRHVDICLMDVHFPDGDSYWAVRAVLEAAPAARVVMLSADCDHSVIAAALAAGATGFVLKRASVDVILEVLQRVHAGELVVRVGGPLTRLSSTSARRLDRRFPEPLTDREREVVRRLVLGQATETMAKEMGIRYSTARTHIQNVLGKLGVHSKLEAVALAVNCGIVSVQTPQRQSMSA